jgi:hypothetical protein
MGKHRNPSTTPDDSPDPADTAKQYQAGYNAGRHDGHRDAMARVWSVLHPNSLESRMDAAVNCDSEVVRHLRRILGVPTDRAAAPPSSLERDQQLGDERRREQQ